MTVYETPNEPMGPVYDAQGNKWRKDEAHGCWLKTTNSIALTWGTLVCVYGPLSDTPNFKVGQTVDVGGPDTTHSLSMRTITARCAALGSAFKAKARKLMIAEL